ncbi:ROK family protein [Arthrobacter gyeryongensis]|uniref:ROK family protein n=1 Tax=Arthrobacter gyeryongensis TaxID=1650592 RepID=A0ABP9S218_9MICC
MEQDDVATSPQLLRKINMGAVLRYALESEAFRAIDAMAVTGLTRSTVLGLCDELAAQGWIEEMGDSREAGQYIKGRPARRYRLRGDAGHIVGVDAGQHTVTAIVADLRGTILARAAQTLDSQRGSVRRSTVRNTVDKALALAGIQPEEVFLVVVGVPAPVDDKGRSPDSTEYWRNMNPDFPAVFADCGRTVVDNDANLAALAERAHGADADSFAALLSGERFGAGLVIDGVLLRGPRGAAGEMRLLNVVEGVGSADGIGLLGRKWAVDASRAGKIPPGSILAGIRQERLSAEAVFDAAAAGDVTALGIVDRLAERLARIAHVLASLLDVEKVIIAGAVAAAVEPVLKKAAAVLAEKFEAPVPALAASALGADGVVLGALECGLSTIRSQPLTFDPHLLEQRRGALS